MLYSKIIAVCSEIHTKHNIQYRCSNNCLLEGKAKKLMVKTHLDFLVYFWLFHQAGGDHRKGLGSPLILYVIIICHFGAF